MQHDMGQCSQNPIFKCTLQLCCTNQIVRNTITRQLGHRSTRSVCVQTWCTDIRCVCAAASRLQLHQSQRQHCGNWQHCDRPVHGNRVCLLGWCGSVNTLVQRCLQTQQYAQVAPNTTGSTSGEYFYCGTVHKLSIARQWLVCDRINRIHIVWHMHHVGTIASCYTVRCCVWS